MDSLVHDRRSAVDSWVIPTFRGLASTGLPVSLGPDLPAQGIVVASSYSLPKLRPNPGVYVVALLADGFVHPRADFTVVQNLEQGAYCRDFSLMPHWPEAQLVPRDPDRGSRCSTLAYFGHPSNLDPGCRSPGFAQALLERFGVNFLLPGPDSWTDYSGVDLVLALRPRSGGVWPGCKPSTKLFNAWIAGSPLIGGYESALLTAGTPHEDFVAVHNARGVLDAVGDLKASPARVAALVQAGRARAASLTEVALASRWARLFEDEIFPLAAQVPKRSAKSRIRKRTNALLYRLKRRGSL